MLLAGGTEQNCFLVIPEGSAQTLVTQSPRARREHTAVSFDRPHTVSLLTAEARLGPCVWASQIQVVCFPKASCKILAGSWRPVDVT